MSTVSGDSPLVGPRGEQRARGLFRSLRESLARAAGTPMAVSQTERAIRLAEALRAELLAGRHRP